MRFLHIILNFPDENITKKVLLQQLNLLGETWLSNTLSVCRKLGICDELDTIRNTPKAIWKKQLTAAILKDETEKLKVWAADSKKYTSVTLNVRQKDYIKYLSPTLAMTILKARTGMTEIKTNYKNMWADLKCRKCHSNTEDLSHMLRCKNSLSEEENNIVEEAKKIIDHIETEEQSKVEILAKLISREVRQLKEMKSPVQQGELESAPEASSEELDIN